MGKGYHSPAVWWADAWHSNVGMALVFIDAVASEGKTFCPLGNSWVQNKHLRQYPVEASTLLN